MYPGQPQAGYAPPMYPGAQAGPPPPGFAMGGGYGGPMAGQPPPMMPRINPTMDGGEFGDGLNDNMAAFGSKAVRLGFIRKVYSILSVQLLVTFGFVLLFILSDETKLWARRSPGLVIFSFIASIVSMLTLACCGSVRRQFPTNFICLGIFTLAQSFMLGMVSAAYKTQIVWLALLMTAVVCIGLTVFAMQTKIDFTVFTGVAFVGMLILMVMGLILMFVRIPILQVIYAGFGALIFCVYLIIDTQMIIGGNHKSQMSPEEYIFGAITLYTDIINIFMFILQILNYFSSD